MKGLIGGVLLTVGLVGLLHFVDWRLVLGGLACMAVGAIVVMAVFAANVKIF